MGGWCHCDADGELCKQEVPVLHQLADVPLLKGHLQADHYQFTAWPCPPFCQRCLYKQGKVNVLSQRSLLLQIRRSRKHHLSLRKALWWEGKILQIAIKTVIFPAPRTALFQLGGWFKPNKVIFRDEPQPSGLFIRCVKLDPTGLSNSCLNTYMVLMKSTMLLMCFKCSLLDPCLYNNSARLPLTTEVFNGPPADRADTQWKL